MKVSVEFTCCLFDKLPIDQSSLYQAMVTEFGKAEADRWTYVEEVPVINHPPPDEVMQLGRPSRTGDQAS